MEAKDKIIAELQKELKIAKKNEERLNTLVQSSPFCIHEINLKGQIISMNKAGLTMMNMQHENEICGVYYTDFVCSKQKSMITQLLNNAFQGKYSTFEFSPENSELIFTSCFAPVFGHEGDIERVMGITEDITLQKKNEEEILKSRKLKSIGLLAGGIAHDFNNLFTGFFGHLQLASNQLCVQHPALKHINRANYALDKATSLTNQLLTFAKGGSPFFETVDLSQTIEESISFLLGDSGIKTKVIFQDGLWKVNADKGQLTQVMTNIVINAKQAMKTRGEITIEAKNIDQFTPNITQDICSEMVCVTISDNGVGIPDNLQGKIFDPYFTTKQSGSGIGLATVYSIIKKHKGYIDVESKVGEGTKFSFYLNPISSANSSSVLPISSTKKQGISSASILIMDDEAMILDILAEMLGLLGHIVETASDGESAIKKYTNKIECGAPFDIVIIDLTIPGGRGGESVIKELLHINPRVKAIVASGYSTGKVMSNPAEYGFEGRLVKPFTMQAVKELITQIIE